MESEQPSEQEREIGRNFLVKMAHTPDSVREVLFAAVEEADDDQLSQSEGEYTLQLSLEEVRNITGYSDSALYRVRDNLEEQYPAEIDFKYEDAEFQFGSSLLLMARAGKRTVEWSKQF